MSQPRPWPAPAKLNLFLHITGRREDGYHLLQSVFQFLDYCDWLHFTPRTDNRIHRLTPVAGVPEEQDLIVRAARLLQQHCDTGQGIDIAIDKRLPMGGGLGGGSSDAATTLVALNRIWQLGLDNHTLSDLGLKLGADVPIFIGGHAAWAEGVGEQLTAIEPPEPWYLVLIPAVHVSTAEIFSNSELTRDCHPIKIRDFLAGHGENVIEPVVRKRHPEVAEALDWLDQWSPSRMTGTGACVFAPFDSEREAEEVLAKVPQGWRGFIAKGLNRSPLLERLQEN